jgi:(2Fe-2S) ferredoxin
VDEPLFFATRAHVLVCTGPRCGRAGSRRVFDEAWRALEREGLAYYKRGGSVRLTESGCLGQCAHGPALAAYHGDAQGALAESWFVQVDAPRVVEIARALHDGTALPERGRFGPR